MAHLKLLHILGVAFGLYLVICYYLYRVLEKNMQKVTHNHNGWPVVQLRKDQNGSWQIFQADCPMHAVIKHSHLSRFYPPSDIIKMVPSTCIQVDFETSGNIIKMEKEWQSIDVGYPQYVYTVSGWIQVIEVPAYTAKPGLHVIIVPHSHQDVGWRETEETYYKNARSTLSNAVVKLDEHRNWTFIWAESTYLSRWYEEATEAQRQSLKRAIADGQLEIVTGGWVMTEEACAHYAPMLDQLTEGHLWLNNTLNVHPMSSWSVDPFGHSPTMTYLLKGSMLKHMVIQRVHFAVKRYLSRTRSLEFFWRQNWDKNGSTDIFCHMMPFLSYAVLYSCGPDPHVCCQFDFAVSKCFRGKKLISPQPVSEINIKKLAWALWEQFQKKAQLYRSNVILVPHGDDFRYDSLSEWDKQLGNLEKLMTYMNADHDMNIKVEFGTISDYFKALRDVKKNQQPQASTDPQYPVLTGDFFPYNDRDDQYWTGFYSSRPLYKHIARILQSRLRLVEVLYMVTMARVLQNGDTKLISALWDMFGDLQHARRIQGIFMHHDAITGTSKQNVVEDYAKLLQGALSKLDTLFKNLVTHTLTDGATFIEQHDKMVEYIPLFIGQNFNNSEWLDSAAFPVFNIVNDSTRQVVVTNPLTTPWIYIVKIIVHNRNTCVTTIHGVPVRQQINPVIDSHLILSATTFELIFEANMPALSVKPFKLETVCSAIQYATISLYNADAEEIDNSLPYTVLKATQDTLDIENTVLKATFSSCTGTLQHVTRKSDDSGHKVEIKFMTYGTGSWTNPFKDKSGAYIFSPDGPAQATDNKFPRMVMLEGPLMASIITSLPGVLHSVSLYNVSGPLGAGLHVENVVSLDNKLWNNKEFIMRLVTDIESPGNDVCVDLNGFQMNRKVWQAQRLIQGNFHPANTMAYIDNDHHSRLTLVFGHAHGVASLNSGWLEVLLDRRLMQDDWRGMGEGVKDNAPTPSRFIILLEKKKNLVPQTSTPTSPCHPSLLSHLLSEHLNNPPAIILTQKTYGSALKDRDHYALLIQPLPCTLDLVNLRTLQGAGAGGVQGNAQDVSALLVLHSAGIDCDFVEVHTTCDLQRKINIDMFTGTKVSKIMHTSLTGVQDIKEHTVGETEEIPAMELRTYKITFS